MPKSNTVTVEIGGDRNQNHLFRPLGKRVRGRFDAQTLLRHDTDAGRVVRDWPQPIPGQRLVLDYDTGTAYLNEPLQDEKHVAMRQKLEQRGFSIEKTKEFPSVDVATWSHWMQSAVDAGCARVVHGEFRQVEGTPQTSFIVTRSAGPFEQLSESIRQQTMALEKQTEMLGKVLAKLG